MRAKYIYFIGIVLSIALIFFYVFMETQGNETYIINIEKFRKEKDESFKISSQSPIPNKEEFKSLQYFDPNLNFRIAAQLQLIQDTTAYLLKMTDKKEEKFYPYAYAIFSFAAQPQKLLLLKKEKNNTDLFLAFKDKSNSTQTYQGGRYLDIYLEQLNAKEIIIDFNFAYNPYCVYNKDYTCPIPPTENHLSFEVLAGEKRYQ